MLLFVDLETTGLTPSQDDVLEIAAIITRDDLTEVARFERVIYSHKTSAVLTALANYGIKTVEQFRALPETRLTGSAMGEPSREGIGSLCGVDPYVIAMHLENGLWEKSRRGENILVVDEDFRAWVQEYGMTIETKTFGPDGTSMFVTHKPQLAGSTISFDREFLRAHFPRTVDEKTGVLHHRNCDVSTLNEVARRFWPAVYDGRPGRDATAKHRGMDDICASIEVLKHYLTNVAPVIEPRYAPESQA